jgi:signal transduction histidine kinase/CheY-like chemotaxis protein
MFAPNIKSSIKVKKYKTVFNKSRGEKDMKIKVFVSYAVIFLLISSILYFTFGSFQKLTQSADALAQPNKRIGLLHNIVYSIYQAESNIRSYSLNEEESYLNAYFEDLFEINQMVDSLYMISGNDAFIIETIDSINLQLCNKTQLLEQFIDLKKSDRNSVFYQSAVNEILEATEEETRIKEITHQSIIDSTPVPALEFSSEEISEKNNNFFKRIRNFFTGPDEKSLEMEARTAEVSDALLMIQEIRTDSIITVYRDTEQLREEIENSMVTLMQQMLRKEKNLQRRENNILLQDKKVMDQIWEFITILEDYEKDNAIVKASQAHQTVNSTTNKIFGIVVVSLIILMIFSWLFVNDVNRSRFYKKQLMEQKARAEQLVELKQRFMANMSHEIRTPLNSIIGFSDQLQKKNYQANPAPYIHAIYQSSRHLLGIVNDILDFSKIEAEKVELDSSPINISHLANDVYNSLHVIALEKNLEFITDISELNNPVVLGDALRIRQILLNIVGNAIKFTSTGSVKLIVSDFVSSGKPDINHIRFRVADTGIGIPVTDQEHIFEEFAQSDSRPNRSHGGTGLGLSISKKLVDLMGGKIEMFSQPDKGTTFNIYLPLVLCEEQVVEFTQEKEFSFPEDFEARILLVDDDHLNRLLFKSILSNKDNISIKEAENAQIALEMLANEEFDLVITDIQMPGMTGLEMVKILRSDLLNINTNTPILGCTADITNDTSDSILDCGMNDFLLKPIDAQALMEKILSLVHSNTPRLANEINAEIGLQSNGLNASLYNNQHNYYELSTLKSFTGNDSESLATVLNVFFADTRENLQKLENCLNNGNGSLNHIEIYNIVHKMSNMFGLLNASNVLFYLDALNGIKDGKLSNDEIFDNIRNLKASSDDLIRKIEADFFAAT